MTSTAYTTISLFALIIGAIIGVLYLYGVGRVERVRGVVGALLLSVALLAAIESLLEVGVVSYAALTAIIICEILYFARLLPKRERVVAEPTPSTSTFADVVKEIIEDVAVVEKVEEVEIKEHDTALVAAFEAWVAQKGYLDNGVTIQRVAEEIKSNRTYLSSYINSRYNTTFREWLTSQRLEEAKRLLIEEREATISDIALRVGFASVASFSRAFTRQEGEPPAAWRS